MITGRKHGAPADGIERDRRGPGMLLLAAVLGFWWWQWQHPDAGVARTAGGQSGQEHRQDDED